MNPLNPYALSKFNLENFLIEKSKQLSIKYIILRYFNVAGAEKKMRTGLISKFSTHLIKVACEVAKGKKKELIINGDDYDTIDGTPVRDYIHISDLADIHLLCAEDLMRNHQSNIFNCGYVQGFSVKEVLNTLNTILKFNISTKIGPRRPSDSKYVVANSDKFKNYFSWKPKYNNLKYILETALEWEEKIK
jgi:UDP-glucose 4-epimerase